MDYSPWDLLPAPVPATQTPQTGYFYNNVAKYLIKDAVRIMDNGLAIDLEKVALLEDELSSQLEAVSSELSKNPAVRQYLDHSHALAVKAYIKKVQESCRTPDYYFTSFDHTKMDHRSYFMYFYSEHVRISAPSEKIVTGIPKWPKKLVKKYAKTYSFLNKLLDGTLPKDDPFVLKAMHLYAQHKADIYNSKYLTNLSTAQDKVPYPLFNPASSKQKQEFFAFHRIESDKTSSKTGLASWDRAQVENLHKTTTDPDIKNVCQLLIDYSFAAIIKNNFINAFYNYTVEGRLYGQYKLLGAKTGRYTSSNPNMLNTPSTGSRFAKAVKQCFIAPPGKVIMAADYSALEDRVVANLSKDDNKLGLFLEGLDGHSLSATYYYPARVAEIIGSFTDNKAASQMLKEVVDDETHELKSLAKAVRQDSKPISFGLAYGAYPPKVAATVKIPLEEAEKLFNAYHNEMYPGITNYRENYVLPIADKEGRIHLGLGFYIYTDDARKDIRTLFNSTCQFWSILTALVINKMHQLIDKNGYQDDVKVISTIYDSIYFEVTNDPKIIKWLNDTLIPVMVKDFIEDQIVPNESQADIGYNWAEMVSLPVDASYEDIQTALSSL